MAAENKQYGVMLVGCGHIGEQHLQDIYYRENIRITALADLNEERARLLAAKYGRGAAAGADYRNFLSDPATEIVIIATNANSHTAILEDCLAAGKHVLCEKPIATTLEEGRRFCELARRGPGKVLVAHVLRHNATYRKVAALIRQGAVGRLKLMRMIQNHHTMDWPRYAGLLRDCSPVVDCGVHYFDVMQWFTGSRITEVSGFSTWLEREEPLGMHDNYGHVHVRLENGCTGYYEAGWSRHLASCNIKEFIGDAGRITITLRDNRTADREEGDLITLYDGENYTLFNQEAVYKNMYGQLLTLIGMIEEDKPAVPALHDVYSAFAAACSAEEAMKTGQWVRVSGDADSER